MKLLKIITGLALMFVLVNNSLGQDNLFLCGKIKEVTKNEVLIDVFSESCKGLHKFLASKEKIKFLKNRIGKKVCFTITTDNCKEDKLVIQESE